METKSQSVEFYFSILPNGDMFGYSHREAGYIQQYLSPGGQIVMSPEISTTVPEVNDILKTFWKTVSKLWTPVEPDIPLEELEPALRAIKGNTMAEKEKTLTEMLKAATTGKIRAEVETLWNRFRRVYKSDTALNEAMSEAGIQGGWTIGTLGHGRYSYKDKQGIQRVFDERSMTINIAGVPMDVIHRMADILLERFNQMSVLIKDNETNQTYIWNRGDEPQKVSDPLFS